MDVALPECALSSLYAPNTAANITPEDPNLGKISAVSGGVNVTLAAGATLATYSFTVPEGTEGSYSFTLTVWDAADENGEPLSWKGAAVDGSVVLRQKPASGIISVHADSAIVTVTITEGEEGQPLYLASYTAAGQMREVHTLPVQSGVDEYTFTLTGPGGLVKAFLLDAENRPVCEAKAGN